MSTVILNVGGTKFETLRTTLADSKSQYLNDLEMNNMPGYAIFIDCDPECFKHVLEHLRFLDYKIPSKYKYVATTFHLDKSDFED